MLDFFQDLVVVVVEEIVEVAEEAQEVSYLLSEKHLIR